MRRRRGVLVVLVALPLAVTLACSVGLVRAHLARQAMPTKHAAEVVQVLFSQDSERVLSADENGELLLWRASDLEGPGAHALLVLARPVRTRVPWRACHVVLTPDGTRAVAGYRDGALVVWDLSTGASVELRTKGQPVTALDMASDGNRVLVGHGDPTPSSGPLKANVELWNVNARVREWDRETHSVESVALCPDGRKAAVVHFKTSESQFNGRTQLFEIPSGRPGFRLPDTGRVTYSNDGRWLIAIGWGVRVYDASRGVPTIADRDVRNPRASWRVAGNSIAGLERDRLSLHRLPTLEAYRLQDLPRDPRSCWSVSPSRDRFVAGTSSGEVVVTSLLGATDG